MGQRSPDYEKDRPREVDWENRADLSDPDVKGYLERGGGQVKTNGKS